MEVFMQVSLFARSFFFYSFFDSFLPIWNSQKKLNSPLIENNCEYIIPILTRIDECLAYLDANVSPFFYSCCASFFFLVSLIGRVFFFEAISQRERQLQVHRASSASQSLAHHQELHGELVERSDQLDIAIDPGESASIGQDVQRGECVHHVLLEVSRQLDSHQDSHGTIGTTCRVQQSSRLRARLGRVPSMLHSTAHFVHIRTGHQRHQWHGQQASTWHVHSGSQQLLVHDPFVPRRDPIVQKVL